ncbi:MAG: polysaccharide deacetylase family protein [Gammaproteobacteria bacterium]|nr:MAG: polysaccharide deacetylase family protein [Gammaproteobacteria bacterium]
MRKFLLSMTLKGGTAGRLSVLSFHRIAENRDPFYESVTTKELEQQFCTLKKYFNVLPINKAIQQLQEDTLPKRSVVITFDDGYANNYDLALPLLKKHNLSATFFICSGAIDGGIMWNDAIIESIQNHKGSQLNLSLDEGFSSRIAQKWPTATITQKIQLAQILRAELKYLPLTKRATLIEILKEKTSTEFSSNLMMASSQIKALADSGMEIGGHTLNHPILNKSDDAEAENEIFLDKEKLEKIIGKKINYFAYPNGKPKTDFSERDKVILKNAGYKAAFSTADGVAVNKSDLFAIPRFTPWDSKVNRFIYQMFCNATNPSS